MACLVKRGIGPMALLLLGACMNRPPASAGAVVAVAPVDEAAPPESWDRVATIPDKARLARVAEAWAAGLTAARVAGRERELVRAGAVLAPRGGRTFPAPPPGVYRCRVTRLGLDRAHAFAQFKPFFCYIQAEGRMLTFAKGTGSQRPAGRLWADGEARMIFLGADGGEGDAIPPAYGADPSRDQAGIVERVGDFHWRVALPFPREGVALDVIELVPDPGSTPELVDR